MYSMSTSHIVTLAHVHWHYDFGIASLWKREIMENTDLYIKPDLISKSKFKTEKLREDNTESFRITVLHHTYVSLHVVDSVCSYRLANYF